MITLSFFTGALFLGASPTGILMGTVIGIGLLIGAILYFYKRM